jgi:hypothetical protein
MLQHREFHSCEIVMNNLVYRFRIAEKLLFLLKAFKFFQSFKDKLPHSSRGSVCIFNEFNGQRQFDPDDAIAVSETRRTRNSLVEMILYCEGSSREL